MKYVSLSVCLVFAAATTGAAQTPSPKGDGKVVREPITLTGCVAAGKEHNTYVLSNVQRADKPVGTSGSVEPNTIYWFDPPSKLKPHVGHQVQISGILDDDVDKTKVKEKDGKVELKKENGAHKVEVPAGTTAGAAVEAGSTKRTSYTVKVQSVKKLSGSCAG